MEEESHKPEIVYSNIVSGVSGQNQVKSVKDRMNSGETKSMLVHQADTKMMLVNKIGQGIDHALIKRYLKIRSNSFITY